MIEPFQLQHDALRTQYASLAERLSPEGHFRARVEDILNALNIQGLTCHVSIRPVQTPQVVLARYGSRKERDPWQSSSSKGQTGTVEGIVEWWTDGRPSFPEVASAVQQLTSELFRIIGVHWGEIDTRSLLPRVTTGATSSRLEATLAAQCGLHPLTVAAFLDLDFFKAINSNCGNHVGDEVIAEFASRLRSAFSEDCLVVHRGGDEFLLVLSNPSLSDAIWRLDEFRRRMESEPFVALQRANPCTIAIAAYPRLGVQEPGDNTWTSVFETAFEAIISKKPDRNVVLFPAVEQLTSGKAIQQEDLLRAALLGRANISHEVSWLRPFDHAVIRSLESRFRLVTSGDFAGTTAAVQDTWRTLSVNTGFGIPIGQCVPDEHLPAVTRWAAAVLNALFRVAFVGVGPLSESDFAWLAVEHDGAVELQIRTLEGEVRSRLPLMRSDDVNAGLSEVCVGRPWISSAVLQSKGVVRWGQQYGGSLSPIVLLEVGEERADFAIAAASAACIRVDARPVTGGGLPDFWQSNVTRLVTTAIENPNISSVFVVGDQAHIKKTLGFLDARRAKDTVPSHLARRLGFEDTDLAEFAARDIQVIAAPPLTVDALNSVRALIGDSGTVTAVPRLISQQKRNARRVHLPVPAVGGLDIAEGLRLKTLADAYPVVIQLLRTAQRDEQRDRVDRHFAELVAFKLVLDTPGMDNVPAFWSDEVGRADLHDYYRRVFGDEDALFGQRLRQWREGDALPPVNQLERAVDAVTKSVVEGVSDRRILLTVGIPSIDKNHPLGLSVVHVLPRTAGGRWHVDFVWVWRSVEALVGFPFSAYGSIQQSLDLLSSVNARLTAQGIHLPMGTLTYVALSLHMYVGQDGDDEIARAVVTEALV